MAFHSYFLTLPRRIEEATLKGRSGLWADLARAVFIVVAVCLAVAAMLVAVAWLWGIVLLLTECREAIDGTGKDAYTANRNAMLILAAVLGAPFVIWRAWLAGRQVTINQETQFTANFAKAVEQLGAMKEVKTRGEDGETLTVTQPNIEVRLGAIYALERVMQDSARDAGPIVETLAAYVRENCGEPVELPEDERPKRADYDDTSKWRAELREFIRARLPRRAPADRADVKAALTVLDRRPDHARKGDGKRILPDLRHANLQGADLWDVRLEGADLREARLEGARLGSARLEGADLGLACLEGADLGRACLEGADLTAATLRGAAVMSEFSKVIACSDQLPAQFAETWGHRTETKLPEGVPIPDHWPDTDDLREWYAAWPAYKKSLGL